VIAPILALLQDAATSPHGPASPADSIVVQTPIKGPLGVFMKWSLNLPWAVQLTGMILGAIAGALVAWFIWQRRAPILAWLGARSTKWKMGAAAAGMGVFAVAGFAGYQTNNYFMHDNAFCFSCHPTLNKFDRFSRSKHGELGCHDCHRQSMVDNVKQVFYWMAERPEEIPPHAPVPTKICSECHIQSPTDTGWKRIVSSAGHRVHLVSDTARKLDVQCVTCHGQEVHQFAPVNKTCGQDGCHKTRDTEIVLGKMSGQSTMHCAGCHDFKVPVGSLVSIDSAKRALSPVSNDCLGCHEMQRAMGEFDPRDDRGHNGACGTCHNPHTQKEPKGAFASCATGGCHDKAETETPFHRGLPAKTLNDCGSCHVAHTWTVKHGGGACVDCHRDVMKGSPKAIDPSQRVSRTADSVRTTRGVVGVVGSRGTLGSGTRLPLGLGGALRYLPEGAWMPRVEFVPDSTPRARGAAQPTPLRRTAASGAKAPRRPFSHPTHRELACTNCHASERAHGTVTVRTPGECATCHHSDKRAVTCEGCHDAKSLAAPVRKPVRMTLTAASNVPREKTLDFRHEAHTKAACRDCHTQGPLLGVTKDCAGCHTEHHVATANCASCHESTVPKHTREVHDGCAGSGCHDAKVVATLEASRQVCLSCHQAQKTHKRGGECADCHPTRWTPAAAAVPTR
jgi:hypothetical protein